MQLDGTIIAPTDHQTWGKGLLQWIQFTKLVGITIRGSGIIDGRGSVWWQDSSFDEPIDDEMKLIVPINNTRDETKPTPVMNTIYNMFFFLDISSFLVVKRKGK